MSKIGIKLLYCSIFKYVIVTGERWSKRARRSRTTAGAATDGADSSERDSERHAHNTTHKKGIIKSKHIFF